MLSDRYKFKSEDLWDLYQDKKLDHDQYTKQLEKIREDEIQLCQYESQKEETEKQIWGYELNRNKRIEEARSLKEQEEQEIKSVEEQKQLDEQKIKTQEEFIIERNLARQKEIERLRNRSPTEVYRDEIPNTLKIYRDESKKYRRTHNIFQWMLIVGPILATGATSALLAGDNFKWAAALISISVSIAASATGYYKFREKSFYLQQTADAIEQEYTDAQLEIGAYENQESEKILVLLAKRVQQLRNEQKKREQQLDQPPDTKQSHN